MKSLIPTIALLLASTASHAASFGSICVGQVPKATAGAKSLANSAASATPYEFSIAVSWHRPVATSHDKSVLISNVAIAKPLTVAIKRNGKPFAQFHLSLNKETSSNVCLWYGPLYESWSVWPMSRSKGKCKCSGTR